jgi:adenylate cyclase
LRSKWADVGNVGSSERLSYTVMGDGANVAVRLEGINKSFSTTICIGDSVVQAIWPRIVRQADQKGSGQGSQARVHDLRASLHHD